MSNEKGIRVVTILVPRIVAVENLRVLNHAENYGLWGGRVTVFELGAIKGNQVLTLFFCGNFSIK